MGSLLEFPPVVAYGRVYVGANNGRFLAVDAATGKTDWQKRFDRCIASSPTMGDEVVYQPLMDPFPCREHKQDAAGYVVALDADTGRELWRFEAGVVETSPLVVGDLLYFGSWDKKMYAVDVNTHKAVWTFPTGDQVKAGPAYARGTLFFASYDNKVYAVDARTGKLRWSASGTANFYATPTIAYGRVFIGNTDGRVYAFGQDSGHLLWAKATGGYVYSSAAVWQKTVYVGSYSKRFYALDAGSGDVRWSFDAGGEISGAPTVLDGVVYFSTLERKSFGLDARTGKKLWEFHDGKYSPVVADKEHVYLAGYKRLYGLAPEGG
jgi:outer membrane protein assembly factor BamB